MPEKNNQTAERAKSTQSHYNRIAKSIADQYAHETGLEWRDDPLYFCKWVVHNYLGDKERGFRPRTIRAYRSAVRDLMRREGPQEAVDFLSTKEALELGGRKKGNGVLRNAEKKMTKPKEKDFVNIQEALSESRSYYSRIAQVWIAAIRIAGARPHEWRTARIIDDLLIIKNAKSTHERANGRFRYINLAPLSYEEKSIVYQFTEIIAAEFRDPKSFEKLYDNVRKRIYCAARQREKRVGGRPAAQHPTLYTFRHMFASHAKAIYDKREAVAALMGHAVPETPYHNYQQKSQEYRNGKQGSSEEKGFVAPDIRSIERVREPRSARRERERDSLDSLFSSQKKG